MGGLEGGGGVVYNGVGVWEELLWVRMLRGYLLFCGTEAFWDGRAGLGWVGWDGRLFGERHEDEDVQKEKRWRC